MMKNFTEECGSYMNYKYKGDHEVNLTDGSQKAPACNRGCLLSPVIILMVINEVMRGAT